VKGGATLVDMYLRALADMLAFAAGYAAVFTIPYSVAALLYYRRNRWVRAVRRDPQDMAHRALLVATGLTRLNLVGMIFLVIVYALRVYFQESPPPPEPQPAWSFGLGMLSTLAVLAVFTAPATCLFRLKGEIADRRYTEGEEERVRVLDEPARVPNRRGTAADKEAREVGYRKR
jgi:hypothetical protein